ncbi:sulfite exporter TauE/SafE family protein [Rhodoblastus acidophilus]|uniref:Probable membrane transporter protein n=1 Tax=Candidatus Rhodoblastus alkanivorans TaxID=2954117 RepID=A0ABS9Z586_9HYPH|nr:sulfite exporter TauE/SafE family protein [Candidatus Rhodoblastus alkanivorans]MCI4678486.1 sulfite exporter TauE/SafE family protein [Candidatus Rhodoblastus alkanivorans]MCI4682840.1 sulfite exporter TauE/SafE family protein [Candidatus Rhodoblastus alkanivorans]MDI4640150.1 sulfite exporter TauE/SafE family protein [Rhodoblastus acidophilus]
MHFLLLVLAGFGAGFINALAGGGSFLTFPALIGAGLPAISANATSTIALFPAQIATTYAYRDSLAKTLEDPRINGRILAIVSLVGGFFGAILLLSTSEHVFERLVPFLLLGATLVFAAGMVMPKKADKQVLSATGVLVAQCFVAIYGGYFGGGIGILMLAALTLYGLKDIVLMNSLKMLLATLMNATATAVFLFSGRVHWLEAVVLSAGSIAGGFAGAHAGSRIPALFVRLFVIFIGLVLSVHFYLKTF